MLQKEINQVIVVDGLDWEELSFILDGTDTHILKAIYYPYSQDFAYDSLYKFLNKSRNRNLLAKSNLRRRLERLEKLFLIKLIKTKPLLINSLELSKIKMYRLLGILSMKHKLEDIK